MKLKNSIKLNNKVVNKTNNIIISKIIIYLYSNFRINSLQTIVQVSKIKYCKNEKKKYIYFF